MERVSVKFSDTLLSSNKVFAGQPKGIEIGSFSTVGGAGEYEYSLIAKSDKNNNDLFSIV